MGVGVATHTDVRGVGILSETYEWSYRRFYVRASVLFDKVRHNICSSSDEKVGTFCWEYNRIPGFTTTTTFPQSCTCVSTV